MVFNKLLKNNSNNNNSNSEDIIDLPGSATDILTALLMGVFGVVLG